MRLSKLRVSPFAALAFAWAASAGPSAAQSPYFNFRICNNSNVTAAAVTSVRLDPDRPNLWAVRGWLLIDPGDCASAGAALRGWVYYYAEQKGRGGAGAVWAGNDVQLCVEYPGPFSRINTSGYTCRSRELKGFTGSFIRGNTGTFTVNLN